MKEKDTNRSWFSRHKKIVIIGGMFIAVSAAVAAYLLLKPSYATVTLPEMPKPELPLPDASAIENKTVDTLDSIIQKVVDVESYLRNLPKGQKASPAKVAEATKMGINLPQGKTIVDGYSYSKCVA